SRRFGPPAAGNPLRGVADNLIARGEEVADLGVQVGHGPREHGIGVRHLIERPLHSVAVTFFWLVAAAGMLRYTGHRDETTPRQSLPTAPLLWQRGRLPSTPSPPTKT